MLHYGYTPEEAREVFRGQEITWCERLERIPTDYGPREKTTSVGDWESFTDWEKSPEHDLAIYF